MSAWSKWTVPLEYLSYSRSSPLLRQSNDTRARHVSQTEIGTESANSSDAALNGSNDENEQDLGSLAILDSSESANSGAAQQTTQSPPGAFTTPNIATNRRNSTSKTTQSYSVIFPWYRWFVLLSAIVSSTVVLAPLVRILMWTNLVCIETY